MDRLIHCAPRLRDQGVLLASEGSESMSAIPPRLKKVLKLETVSEPAEVNGRAAAGVEFSVDGGSERIILG